MQDLLIKAVERMRSLGAELCDARWQTIEKTLIVVVDGGVRTLSDDRLGGVCLRARVNGSWGYASGVDPGKDTVLDAANRAVRSAHSGSATGPPIPERRARQAKVRANLKTVPPRWPGRTS